MTCRLLYTPLPFLDSLLYEFLQCRWLACGSKDTSNGCPGHAGTVSQHDRGCRTRRCSVNCAQHVVTSDPRSHHRSRPLSRIRPPHQGQGDRSASIRASCDTILNDVVACVCTGTSKGVAILKFKSVETAAACIEAHAVVDVDDGPVWLEFGFEHTSDDWHCRTCNSLNFHFRPQCFKCGTSKAPRGTLSHSGSHLLTAHGVVDKTTSSTSSTPSNFLNDGSEDVCPTPTKFLLIRGLDAMLDAQMLFEKLSVVDSEIVHVWLVRDRQTLRSRCFAFVQFSAVGVMAKVC